MNTSAPAITAPVNMALFRHDAEAMGVPMTLLDLAEQGTCMCCMWGALQNLATAAGNEVVAVRAATATMILDHAH